MGKGSSSFFEKGVCDNVGNAKWGLGGQTIRLSVMMPEEN
jgi:hypothetical protein